MLYYKKEITQNGSAVKLMAKRFFDPENSLWHWIGKVPEMCGLSVLWLVLSLPVVTLVPASIALYDTVARKLRPDEKGVFRRFFRTFRKELGRGILMGLLWLLIGAVLVWGYNILNHQAKASDSWAIYGIVYLILSALPLGVFCWLIPIESRFVYPYWTLHKNAVLFAISYLPRTFLLLVLAALAVVVCWYMPPLILIMPALLTTLQSIPIESVFKKYMPEQT